MENTIKIVKSAATGGGVALLFYKLFKVKSDEETRQNSIFMNNILEQNKNQSLLLEKTFDMLWIEIKKQSLNQEESNKIISMLVIEMANIKSEIQKLKK